MRAGGRILLITDDFPPDHGGIATYLWELYRHTPEGMVMVVAPDGPGARRFDAGCGLRVFRYRRFSAAPLRYAAAFCSSLRVVLRERPAALHCGTLISSGLIALALAPLFRVPYVLHVYGTDLCAKGRSRLAQWLAVTSLRRAGSVVGISDFSLSCAARLGVKQPALVKILPPVDARRFRPPEGGARASLPAVEAAAGPLLLTVARLVPRKGHDAVIRALPLVLRRLPGTTYLIVGEGPERNRLEALATELGVAGSVRFCGAVEDVVPYYQACDLFVMASRTLREEGEVEGFGIAFCEASACGKPVVGGRSGGVGEAVVDGVTGLLVPPDDPEALASAITGLLDDRERSARMGGRGREWVLNSLDPARAAERIAALAAGAAAVAGEEGDAPRSPVSKAH
ncbi:MAG TPA: glycosyltransferase family 4 protein [Pyrinomonadaceae bacterium]|nr:glycosyltransferase family 4 protein [Pyrinomonadaceae bacterium]